LFWPALLCQISILELVRGEEVPRRRCDNFSQHAPAFPNADLSPHQASLNAKHFCLITNAFTPRVQFYVNGVALNILLNGPTVDPKVSSLIGRDWPIGFVPFRGSKYAQAITDVCPARKAE